MTTFNLTCLQRFAEEVETAPVSPAPAAAEAAAEDNQSAEVHTPQPDASTGLPQSLLEALAQRYQVDSGDLEGLEKAIRDQMARSETSEPEDENADDEEIQQGAQQIYDAWMAQAAQTRQVYPGFDLRQELRNPRFAHLLSSRVDVRTAYEVLHKDEIIPAAMQYAARTVEQKLASALRAAGNRPSENGIRGASTAMVGSDAAHLSRKDYNEICRRVARGERVSFG